jgi:hypothetical protein
MYSTPLCPSYSWHVFDGPVRILTDFTKVEGETRTQEELKRGVVSRRTTPLCPSYSWHVFDGPLIWVYGFEHLTWQIISE